jgi:hypothetical protein
MWKKRAVNDLERILSQILLPACGTRAARAGGAANKFVFAVKFLPAVRADLDVAQLLVVSYDQA